MDAKMTQYEHFRERLKNLEAQYENYTTLSEDTPELIRQGISESTTRRFELCWECLWKALRRYLLEETGLADAPNTPRGVFRMAGESELFPFHVETWMQYLEVRQRTTHDYSGEGAQAALEIMADFIRDATNLYRVMNGGRRP